MKNKITKEFKDGKMILTHPTGVKQELTREQMIAHKEMWLEQKKRIEETIKRIDEDISKLS